jgi:hypothetical protein
MEGKMTEEWRINRIGYATPYETHIFIEDAHGSPICGVWCPPGNEEQEANTLLLAAAPKMARALVEARQFIFDAFGTNTRLANAVVQGNGIDAALLAAGVEHE